MAFRESDREGPDEFSGGAATPSIVGFEREIFKKAYAQTNSNPALA
jgi:hypothetical protein